MTFSILDAIRNVKKDEHWLKKTYVVGLVWAITTIIYYVVNLAQTGLLNMSAQILILCFAIGLVLTLYMSGFNYQTLFNYLNSEDNKMAELGEKNLVLLGLKTILCTIGYMILLLIPTFIVTLIVLLASGLFIGLLYLILHNSVLFKVISAVLFVAIDVLVLVYWTVFISVMITYYGTDLKVKRIFALKTQLRIIKEHHHQCWSLFGKMFLFGLLATLALIITVCTVIGILVLPLVVEYINCAYQNLLAQFGKTIEINKYC